MIYAPGRFLFVHIPRTGGMSITHTLATELTIDGSILIATGNEPKPWVRHARAVDVMPLIQDWDSIHKFAFDRDINEIIESDYRLRQRDLRRWRRGEFVGTSEWIAAIERVEHQSPEEFRQQEWGFTDSPWEYWCCGENDEDLGIERYDFRMLHAEWARLCADIGVEIRLPWMNKA